jgi:hypothetical protein
MNNQMNKQIIIAVIAALISCSLVVLSSMSIYKLNNSYVNTFPLDVVTDPPDIDSDILKPTRDDSDGDGKYDQPMDTDDYVFKLYYEVSIWNIVISMIYIFIFIFIAYYKITNESVNSTQMITITPLILLLLVIQLVIQIYILNYKTNNENMNITIDLKAFTCNNIDNDTTEDDYDGATNRKSLKDRLQERIDGYIDTLGNQTLKCTKIQIVNTLNYFLVYSFHIIELCSRFMWIYIISIYIKIIPGIHNEWLQVGIYAFSIMLILIKYIYIYIYIWWNYTDTDTDIDTDEYENRLKNYSVTPIVGICIIIAYALFNWNKIGLFAGVNTLITFIILLFAIIITLFSPSVWIIIAIIYKFWGGILRKLNTSASTVQVKPGGTSYVINFGLGDVEFMKLYNAIINPIKVKDV